MNFNSVIIFLGKTECSFEHFVDVIPIQPSLNLYLPSPDN